MKKTNKSVVVLRWNPAFSSFGTISYANFLYHMNIHPRNYLNWSVYDYFHVHKDDLCVLLKVGEGATGICLYGKILSESYEGSDWSGRGRPTYYVNLRLCQFATSSLH